MAARHPFLVLQEAAVSSLDIGLRPGGSRILTARPLWTRVLPSVCSRPRSPDQHLGTNLKSLDGWQGCQRLGERPGPSVGGGAH